MFRGVLDSSLAPGVHAPAGIGLMLPGGLGSWKMTMKEPRTKRKTEAGSKQAPCKEVQSAASLGLEEASPRAAGVGMLAGPA